MVIDIKNPHLQGLAQVPAASGEGSLKITGDKAVYEGANTAPVRNPVAVKNPLALLKTAISCLANGMNSNKNLKLSKEERAALASLEVDKNKKSPKWSQAAKTFLIRLGHRLETNLEIAGMKRTNPLFQEVVNFIRPPLPASKPRTIGSIFSLEAAGAVIGYSVQAGGWEPNSKLVGIIASKSLKVIDDIKNMRPNRGGLKTQAAQVMSDIMPQTSSAPTKKTLTPEEIGRLRYNQGLQHHRQSMELRPKDLGAAEGKKKE
ncbi:MAG: hypothetical protein FWF24_01965 [Alphaproteobacteria bacterium]|nr:hypothetical protein [Alphaproteobacteria bacterium]